MYIYLIGRGYLNLIHPYNFIEYVAVFVVNDLNLHIILVASMDLFK